MKKTLAAVRVGVNLLDLEKIAEQVVIKEGGAPSFKTVAGYKWTTCLTVNDEVVHGIPRDIVLKKGDLLSIDLGAVYQGWHTDAAWSVVVGEGSDDFLKTGEQALWKAVDQAVEGKRIGDISDVIQQTIEGKGYSVVRALVGHGVGKKLHEEPQVPGVGKAGSGMKLWQGMTIAIEAIYTKGKPDVKMLNDGWTIASSDGSLGGLFEMTVIVGKGSPEVITDWRSV